MQLDLILSSKLGVPERPPSDYQVPDQVFAFPDAEIRSRLFNGPTQPKSPAIGLPSGRIGSGRPARSWNSRAVSTPRK